MKVRAMLDRRVPTLHNMKRHSRLERSMGLSCSVPDQEASRQGGLKSSRGARRTADWTVVVGYLGRAVTKLKDGN